MLGQLYDARAVVLSADGVPRIFWFRAQLAQRLVPAAGAVPRNVEWAGVLASNSSVKAPLQPVKLFEGICKGGCYVSSRFTVQTISLD